MISEASKRELKRRQREQIQLLTERIREREAWLEKHSAFTSHAAYTGVWAHRRVLPNGKMGEFLTEQEMHAHVLAKLDELRESLAVWSRPFDFEQQMAIIIPKSVARAMNRLRKRTRRMLRKQQKET